MKDPANAVYTAVTSLLEGNVTVGATTLPVYSIMPDSVGSGYVYIESFTGTNDDLKDAFMQFGNLTIQVVIPIGGASGSKRLLNDFNNKVLELLKPTVSSTLDLSPNFNNTYFYTQNVTEFLNLFDNNREIRRVTQLNLLIEEL